MLPIEACREYAKNDIAQALVDCDVVKYQNTLVSKINDLCLQMGAFCQGDKQKYQCLAEALTQEINKLTSDRNEQGKLYQYVNQIITVVQHFSFFGKSY